MKRRVSLAGRVTPQANDPAVTGGELTLATVDEGNGGWPRKYRTRIREDGYYFFLNLQSGQYNLSGRDERGRDIEAKTVAIPPSKGDEKPPVVCRDLVTVADDPAQRRRGQGKTPTATK